MISRFSFYDRIDSIYSDTTTPAMASWSAWPLFSLKKDQILKSQRNKPVRGAFAREISSQEATKRQDVKSNWGNKKGANCKANKM